MTNPKKPSNPKVQPGDPAADPPAGTPGTPGTVPPPNLTCEEIERLQNEILASHATKKVNTLSCRCSGCRGDGKLPVLTSPADAQLLNTAYNGTGGFLPNGSQDPHWEIGTNGDANNIATNWAAAGVNYMHTAWATSPFSNANWLGIDHTGDVYVYYRIRFHLGSGVNPSTFALLLDCFSDNVIEEVWANLAPQSVAPSNVGKLPGGYYSPGSNIQLMLDNHWQHCDNEIIFKVHSVGGPAGLLVQNSVKAELSSTGCDCDCDCHPAVFPTLQPCITVKWGESKCDCLESDDVEVLSISVCNCYSNVTFDDFSIGQIVITDLAGNPVATLPDGTPSVEVVPSGPICFGDIPPCTGKDKPSCVTREVVLHTRGAVGKDYRLTFRGICFEVCHHYQVEQCFNLTVCPDR